MSYLLVVMEWIKWMFGVVPRSAVGSPRLYLIVHYSFMALLAILFSVFSEQIRKLLNYLFNFPIEMAHLEVLDRIRSTPDAVAGN